MEVVDASWCWPVNTVVMARVIYIKVKRLCILLIDCPYVFGSVIGIKNY